MIQKLFDNIFLVHNIELKNVLSLIACIFIVMKLFQSQITSLSTATDKQLKFSNIFCIIVFACKAKLSNYPSIYVPTLTNAHEL